MSYKNILFYLFSFASINHVLATNLKIGLVTEVDFPVYKDTKNDLTVLPLLDYDNGTVYIDGFDMGAYLYQNDQHELAINANYHDNGFRPKDSSNEHMQKLDKRHETIMLGVNYTHIANWGVIDTRFNTDILGKNKGFLADVGYLAVFQKKHFTFAPKIGVSWHSNHYNNYYYGVSQQESKKTGFQSYQSRQSIQPYLEMNMNYQISPKVDIFFSGRYEQLRSQIKNSPIVEKSYAPSIQLGMKYQFQ
ncbi:MipA/OmpV family protein [Neisseria sp. Ec49-e6-T10]|uniref:MipA/OmpV family protein n=1 Tax=Neisseria sp. Ec49-e6-T10 TaxID=3140744 RepID=UPI003EB81038